MVESINRIFEYFPDLSAKQKSQFEQLGPIYRDLNKKINVISRKDIDSLYVRHVLHSMAIAKFIQFKPDTEVVDLGTGGGFPGVPWAILFPEVRFLMIDGTAKKIRVVNEVVEHLGLDNGVGYHKRSEELRKKFDFVLARAVTRLDKLIPLARPLISSQNKNAIPNGLITLKGGDLSAEIQEVAKQNYIEHLPLTKYFSEEFFETKSIVYVQG